MSTFYNSSLQYFSLKDNFLGASPKTNYTYSGILYISANPDILCDISIIHTWSKFYIQIPSSGKSTSVKIETTRVLCQK